MADCPECRRPFGHYDYINKCNGCGGDDCNVSAAAYRRGIRDMLAVAKRTVKLRGYVDEEWGVMNTPDWTATEREAAKLAGEER